MAWILIFAVQFGGSVVLAVVLALQGELFAVLVVANALLMGFMCYLAVTRYEKDFAEFIDESVEKVLDK